MRIGTRLRHRGLPNPPRPRRFKPEVALRRRIAGAIREIARLRKHIHDLRLRCRRLHISKRSRVLAGKRTARRTAR